MLDTSSEILLSRRSSASFCSLFKSFSKSASFQSFSHSALMAVFETNDLSGYRTKSMKGYDERNHRRDMLGQGNKKTWKTIKWCSESKANYYSEPLRRQIFKHIFDNLIRSTQRSLRIWNTAMMNAGDIQYSRKGRPTTWYACTTLFTHLLAGANDETDATRAQTIRTCFIMIVQWED